MDTLYYLVNDYNTLLNRTNTLIHSICIYNSIYNRRTIKRMNDTLVFINHEIEIFKYTNKKHMFRIHRLARYQRKNQRF